MSEPAPLRICENCRAALQGGYCHLCGQAEHGPVRRFWHAVEEVFESVWHLDGRIFRSLRDLLVPGRIPRDYLAGHRVRYVAPLRLFVILAAVAFFMAQFMLDNSSFGRGAGAALSERLDGSNPFLEIDDPDEIERLRRASLDELARARAVIPPDAPGGRSGLAAIEQGERAVDAQADARLAQLGATPARQARPDGAEDDGPSPVTSSRDGGADPDAGSAADTAVAAPEREGRAVHSRAATGRERFRQNADRIEDDPMRFTGNLIGAAPMALLITVPLFSLLLKLFYVFTGRLYLEHTVIALYSHAGLMLALLLTLLLALVGEWLHPYAPWIERPYPWVVSAPLLWMPIYLLWTQKRVYAQSWPLTLLKYCVIGAVYLTLVTTVAVAVAFYVLYTM